MAEIDALEAEVEAIQDPLRKRAVGIGHGPRHLHQRRGEEPRLLHHRALLLVQEVLLVGVEVPEPGDGQEDEEGVEQQQPDGQPRVTAPETRPPRPDAWRHASPARSR